MPEGEVLGEEGGARSKEGTEGAERESYEVQHERRIRGATKRRTRAPSASRLGHIRFRSRFGFWRGTGIQVHGPSLRCVVWEGDRLGVAVDHVECPRHREWIHAVIEKEHDRNARERLVRAPLESPSFRGADVHVTAEAVDGDLVDSERNRASAARAFLAGTGMERRRE
jgi:hypothetical protein